MAQYLDATGSQYMANKIKDTIKLVYEEDYDPADIDGNVFCVVEGGAPEANEYMYITALENTVITVNWRQAMPGAMNTFECSKDKTTWTNLYGGNSAKETTIALTTGEKLYFRGTGYGLAYRNQQNLPTASSSCTQISSSGKIDLAGNSMSLFWGDNFAGKTTFPTLPAYSVYCRMPCLFRSCIKLIHAHKFVLPALNLMDNNDAENANYNYYEMFRGCVNLVSAPVLPATTLSPGCYNGMFRKCLKLNSITMLADSIPDFSDDGIFPGRNPLYYWVGDIKNDASDPGTLRVKAAIIPTLDAEALWANGKPNHWVYQQVY